MGIEQEIIIKYRYPGTKFFESHQHDIFFGREQETRDLIHSIKAHDVFVIFADSGIGKTSLLNAGLIPELEKENIKPIHFRFQDTETPPVKTIVKNLSLYCKQPGLLAKDIQQELWRLFKCCDFKNKTPLFILDQFEEFFNHTKQDKEECITELADLINDYLPDYIRDEMREKFREKDPTEQELKYYTPAHVKMLFLIRADKLKFLDELTKKIPLILRNRFHLKPLNVAQAKQAILLPASLPQNGFTSPSFTFQPEAVNAISSYLKNEEEEVESFQLQVLCQELEKKILHRSQKENGMNTLQITEGELGGNEGMDNITKNYYTNQLNTIADEAMRKKAVALIEDELIVNERRISLPEVLLLSRGYSKELLDYLLNTTRLIRIDNDRYVEISHDRLLSSILKSKAQRMEEENKAKEIKELQRLKEEEIERNRQLQKQKEEEIKNLELQFLQDKVKKAKRLRIYLYILIILLAGLLYAIVYTGKAETQTKIAMVNFLRSQQNYTDADSVLNNRNLFSLLSFSYVDTLKQLSNQVKREMATQDTFTAYINKGDSLLQFSSFLLTAVDSLLPIADSIAAEKMRLKEVINFATIGNELKRLIDWSGLRNGRDYYLKAQLTGYIPNNEEQGAGSKLRDVDDKISNCFKQCIDATYVFIKANDEQGAKEIFKKSENLYSFATDTTRNIPLSPDDIPYLDSLKLKLP
jgi:hypothetical protein